MRHAFTLVELVVIILILGILASVAAIKTLNVSDAAQDNSARESLKVVRNAIDLFSAKHAQWPGADGSEATFKSDLAPFIRSFPALAIGPAAARDNAVLMSGDAGTPTAEASPTDAWKYYFKTGDIIINLHERMKTDSSIYYDEL